VCMPLRVRDHSPVPSRSSLSTCASSACMASSCASSSALSDCSAVDEHAPIAKRSTREKGKDGLGAALCAWSVAVLRCGDGTGAVRLAGTVRRGGREQWPERRLASGGGPVREVREEADVW
jgi:hypothetical protein